MFKSNKGCTIFEFFALLFTFEIVVFLLVPRIFSLIRNYREETLIYISKTVASYAEKEFIKNKQNNIDEEITCEGILDLKNSDYINCNIYMNNKTAYVTLKGKGKYENMNICGATKDSSFVLDNCNERCLIDENVNVTIPYKVKSYSSCINYTQDVFINDRGYDKQKLENFCRGKEVNGYSFSDNIEYLINKGFTKKELIENNIIEGNIDNVCIPKDVHKACYSYNIKSDGNEKYLEIINYDDKCGSNIEIPEIIDGMIVKSIGEKAFLGKNINSVKFPSTIKYIGNNAFRGYGGELTDNLSGVRLTGILDLSNLVNLEKIGYFAFGDNKITQIIFPSNILQIDGYAFSENNITGILDLSNTKLTTISEYAFSSNKIFNIKLPLSIKTIGYTSFAGNEITGILDLSLNTNLISIGTEAFSLNNIESIILPHSVEKIGNEAFSYNEISEVLDLRNNINLVEIGNKAFLSNNVLEIILPENIKNIGKSSFELNDNLKIIINSSKKVFDWNTITKKDMINSCVFDSGKCGDIVIKKHRN